MSILLEALKKAQEEKKLEKGSGNLAAGPKETVSTPDASISEEDLALLLGKTRKTPQKKAMAPEQTKQPIDTSSLSIEEGLSDGVLVNDSSSSIENDMADQSTPELSLSLLDENEASVQEEFKGVDAELSKIDQKEIDQKNAKASTPEERDLHLTLSDGDVLDLVETDQSLNDQDNSDALEGLLQQVEDASDHSEEQLSLAQASHQVEEPSLTVDEQNSQLKRKQNEEAEALSRLDFEKALEDEKVAETHHVAEQTEVSSEAATQEKPKVTTETEQEKSEHDDSYDWSLSQIPGFEMDAEGSDSKNNDKTETDKTEESKSFISQFKKSQQAKPKSSRKKGRLKKIFLFLLITTILVSVSGYFGWEYSKTLQEQVSAEVMAYQNKLNQITSETNLKGQTSLQKPKQAEVNSTHLPMKAQNHTPATPAKLVKVDAHKKTEAGKTAPLQKSSLKTQTEAHPLKTAQMKQVKKRVVKTPKPQNPVHIQTKVEKDLRLQAFEAFQQGKYAQSQQLYRRAALKYPKDQNVWLGLGASSLALGEKRAALNYYQQALKINPSNLNALKAVVMLSPEKDQNWLAQVKTLWMSTPKDPDINFMLGGYYAQKGDWLNAKKYFKNAVDISPNSSDILLNYAIALDHLGHYSEAIQYYRKALAANNDQGSLANPKSIKSRIQLLQQFLLKTHRESQ